jgi:hypothetical protein
MLNWRFILTLTVATDFFVASANLLQPRTFISPTSCNKTSQYYDTISLSCKDCPSNTISTDSNKLIPIYQLKLFSF